MSKESNRRLDALLRGAYPETTPVSADFSFRLWKRLMGTPAPAPFLSRVAACAAAVGIIAGLASWQQVGLAPAGFERLDLFGNAPADSLAGVYLRLADAGRESSR